MIGVDSNVLLRWIIDDPTAPRQRAVVVDALSGPGPFYVNHVVLAETTWVLGRRTGMSRAEIAGAIATMLDAPTLRMDRGEIIRTALDGFSAGGGGFADHLIGALNRVAGCDTTLTFDRAAARSPDFTDIA